MKLLFTITTLMFGGTHSGEATDRILRTGHCVTQQWTTDGGLRQNSVNNIVKKEDGLSFVIFA